MRAAIAGMCGWAGTRHLAAYRELGIPVTHFVDAAPDAETLGRRLGVERVTSIEALARTVHEGLGRSPAATNASASAQAALQANGRALARLVLEPAAALLGERRWARRTLLHQFRALHPLAP